MLDLIRDPLWQFVGALLALAAIVVAVFLYRLQAGSKSLAYQVISDSPLFRIDEDIRGKLQVVYEGTPVQDVNLLILKIINDGTIPISSADYEQRLGFGLGSSRILDMEIVEKYPETLKPRLNHENGKVTLEPMLLNSRDSFTIRLLVTQYDRVIKPEARIIGVREIKRINNKNARATSAGLSLMSLLIGFVAFVGAFIAVIYRQGGASALAFVLLSIFSPLLATMAFLTQASQREQRKGICMII